MLKLFNKGHRTADEKTSSEFMNLDLTWLNALPPTHLYRSRERSMIITSFLMSCMKSICWSRFALQHSFSSIWHFFLLFQQISSLTWPFPPEGTQFHDLQLKPKDLSKALPERCHPLQLFPTQEMHLAKNRIYFLYPKPIMQSSPKENFQLSGWREKKE